MTPPICIVGSPGTFSAAANIAEALGVALDLAVAEAVAEGDL